MGAILVIEDNLSQGKEMTRVLVAVLRPAKLNHRVVWALNGHEALYHLQYPGIDLVSVDGSFPETYKSESSKASALKILRALGMANYAGRTIFYSKSRDDVRKANGMEISGKSVQAYRKVSVAQYSPESDVPEASILEWAQECVKLLKM